MTPAQSAALVYAQAVAASAELAAMLAENYQCKIADRSAQNTPQDLFGIISRYGLARPSIEALYAEASNTAPQQPAARAAAPAAAPVPPPPKSQIPTPTPPPRSSPGDRNGRALWAWAKKQEEAGQAGVVAFLFALGRSRRWPKYVADWPAEISDQAYQEACRWLQERGAQVPSGR